ncbi:MAG TPA: ribosome-binding factor A [Acidimicrobiales bacterium]|nr:ribosome-binding factor A [Acidimicrobiales bacterium]
MARSRHRGTVRSYPRLARVNALIQEVLAEKIERLADADGRLALLTVTDVACEADLRHAVVYLASLSPDAAEALEARRRGLQKAIGTEARLKRTPTLRFAVDPAIVEGNRIEEALRRANVAPGEAGDAGPRKES